MWSVDTLNRVDSTLGAQLRLALASPLWKDLPYGSQINPRSWRVDVLDVRPRRRLCARIVVPWRSAAADRPPLFFILTIWHRDQASRLTRLLAGLNATLAARPRARRLLFYDRISRTFVAQYRAPEGSDEVINPRWARRLFRALCARLRR